MTAVADLGTTPEGWVAGTWIIDPAHTMVSFAVRHLMSRVRGTFSEVSDQVTTGADPSGSIATVPGDVLRQHRGAPGRWLAADVGGADHPGRHPAGGPGGRVPRHRPDGAEIFIGDQVDLVLDVQAYLGG